MQKVGCPGTPALEGKSLGDIRLSVEGSEAGDEDFNIVVLEVGAADFDGMARATATPSVAFPPVAFPPPDATPASVILGTCWRIGSMPASAAPVTSTTDPPVADSTPLLNNHCLLLKQETTG